VWVLVSVKDRPEGKTPEGLDVTKLLIGTALLNVGQIESITVAALYSSEACLTTFKPN
jgi:hypothetical protein